VREAWLAHLASFRQRGTAKSIRYVVPLLFESKLPYPEIQRTILITAPEAIRIARAVTRDRCTPDEARARISAQLPDDVKAKKSDYVIVNDSDAATLERRAAEVFSALSREVGSDAT
jgi:dephospho-CoA kinase